MRGPARLGAGLLTDATRPIGFRFDGRARSGLAGDTLASALLAGGTHLIGRSFKYHRPRGIVTAGPEEPCALVDVISTAGREPNHLATTLTLHEGLIAESQNRWPSLRFDALALNDLLGRFLPAGFYYKTFMSPRWAWERCYEPLIRRAAGLGRLQAMVGEHAAPAETVHEHTDVLIVGAGAAGLSAAHILGSCGLKVVLAEQDVVLGGGALLQARCDGWRAELCAGLTRLPSVRCLPRTAVLGAYGHGVFAALETLTSEEAVRGRGLRERLHIIRARRVLIATGAVERLIAFADNDRPGVMLAGAALRFLRGYGVAVGHRPACFFNNDEAYEALWALRDAGVQCAGVIDVREQSLAAERARAYGVPVYGGGVVEGVRGRRQVRSVTLRQQRGPARLLEADCLLMSAGHSPATALASQLGAPLRWSEAIAAFVPDLAEALGQVAGAARGVFGLAAAARDGESAARAIAAQLGCPAGDARAAAAPPADEPCTPPAPLWEVPGRGKAFVDLQNDVTAADVRFERP